MISTVVLLAAVNAFNWTKHIPGNGLEFSEKGGELKFVLSGRGHAMGGDGYVEAGMPLYQKGYLDFDIKSEPPRANRGMSLFLSFYDITVFWHDACRDWRVYTPGPESKRERGFKHEPTRHQQMAMFEAEVWHHCRIGFDRALGRVEFFLDDMADPVYILGDQSVWGAQEFLGGTIKIGGLGLSRGSTYFVKNVALSETAGTETAPPRTETLVFEGFANDYYDLRTRLADAKPRYYTLVSTRAAETASNRMRYTGMPGMSALAAAKTIVLADAPVGPGNLIPHFVVEDIVRQVEDGATLVVLDGYFSMKRGKYDESALKDILPEGALPATGFGPLPDKPEILVRKVGKGEVRFFRGLKFTVSPKDFAPKFDAWFQKLF